MQQERLGDHHASLQTTEYKRRLPTDISFKDYDLAIGASRDLPRPYPAQPRSRCLLGDRTRQVDVEQA